MSTIIKGIKQFVTLVPERDNLISNRRAWLGVFAVVVTQLTDFLTTTVGLSSGAEEQNGLMLDVITNYGTFGFLGIKLLAGLFLAWYSFRRRFAPWIISGIYTGVTLWNLLIITAL
jgi:hypothetical protein